MAAEDSRSFDAPRNSSTSGANDHVVTVSEESEGKNKCTACGMLVRGHLGQCGSAKCLYGLVFKLSARVEDLEKAGRVRQDELESSESLSSERQNGLLETIRLQQERIDELEKKIERLASEKEESETPLQTTVSVEDTEDRTPTSTPLPTKDDTMSYSEATCPRERTQSEGSFIPAKSRGSRRKPTVSQASNQKIDNENKPPQHGKCPRVENGAHGTKSNAASRERPKSANTRKTKNPARFPTPASEDLLSLVSDRKDQTERVVLYVGNLKVGTTFESLTTYVTERSKNIGVRCPEVFNGKVFPPQTDTGTYCARITVDEESAEALADRSFWPRPLYVRPWKFNRKQQRGRPDNVQSTSGIDQQPPASAPDTQPSGQ